jgi:hypothetical protein
VRRAEAALAEALGRDEERGALLQEREGLRARLAAAAEEAAELRRAVRACPPPPPFPVQTGQVSSLPSY